jgi:hypothetical protein
MLCDIVYTCTAHATPIQPIDMSIIWNDDNVDDTRRGCLYTSRLTERERHRARRKATMMGVDMATYFRHLLRADLGLPTFGGER